MKLFSLKSLAVLVSMGLCATGAIAQPKTLSAALDRGTATGSFNLRYEGVEEDNALKDASAVTLRSTLKYTTGTISNFTGVFEFEDVRIVGQGDYSVPTSGYKTGRYSVINDPETTELNQSYLQYVSGRFTGKLGRQDIRYDNQRFIGAVPWRQDYQSFDAFSLQYKNDAALTLDYNYITKRERIFAQDADIDSKDHLIHGFYPTPIGTITGYAYLLEEDIVTNNSLDTYGVRLVGAKRAGPFDATYLAEWATQDSERGAAEFSADYYALEGGLGKNGYTGKLGIESLGSDNARYGFGTPLATLHAFEGWADQFLATPVQGIEDTYVSFAKAFTVGKLNGAALTFVYHDYQAEQATATIDDMGDELNLMFTLPIKNNYVWGVKYADYSKGDIAAKVDKQIIWTWLQVTF